jgi:hypothetical protein
VIGESTGKKPLHLVLAADPPVATLEAARKDQRLKVVVMANIHAGEVEGKEAVLVFLREIAEGRHADVLRRVVVAFIPDYNPDGNDRIDRRNRHDQAGPVEGVGLRHNGQDLDLNRDYVKVEAPETEALIRAVRALDAALVVDCHTTNGSFHGFDLTYAGPLHPATDPGILDFQRKTFLPGLQERMRARHGFETFDYGNWVDENDPSKGWATFECVPRFGNSYFGLRNRMTLLSEAYSHEPFEKRIRSTHALVQEALGLVAEHDATIRKVIADADALGLALLADRPATPPLQGRLVRTEASRPIPVGGVREEKDPVTGLVRQWDTDVSKPVPMPVFAWFEGERLPFDGQGWIVRAPSERLLRLIEIHGFEHVRIDRDRLFHGFTFEARTEVAKRSFQGHKLRTITGKWTGTRALAPSNPLPVPRGSVYVPAAQPLGRLAFVLFDPRSEDGFGTWGLLDVTDGVFDAIGFDGWVDK